jgi:hypothetical protein
MSNKFFRNHRALFMFDPRTYKTYSYETGKWVESNESGFLDEIRFHTVELSMSEVLHLLLSRGEEQNCQVN